MSTAFVPDPSHFTKLTGAYYPTGHVFAMFGDEAAANAAAERLRALPGVGAVTLCTPDAIESAFAERAAQVGGAPSVGREDQFMLRYVELARAGTCGVLVELDNAGADALRNALEETQATLAYHYRTLVIDELISPTPRAEAAAAGRL